MAYRESDFDRGWAGAWAEAERNGVAPYVADAHAWATGVLAYWGFTEPERPDIISGYRSPQRQRQLQWLWDRGHREGLTARPASSSYHTQGRAIDVQAYVDGFPWYAYLLVNYTGARDGRTFGDPGHFDWP